MRIFGSKEYGQYSFLLSQYNLIVALGFGWLNQAQLRYFSKESSNPYYNKSQIKAFFYSALFCFIIISIFILSQTFSIEIWLISILAITTIGIFNYIKTYYQARLLPLNVLYLSAIQSLLSILLPLIIIFFCGRSVTSLIFGVALSFIISSLIVINNNNGKKSFGDIATKNQKEVNKIIKKWFFYGRALSIWFSIGLALSFLDRYYINYYLHPVELGYYASLQEILVRSFSLTLFPFTLALHPRIMDLWNKSKFQESIELIVKSFYLMLIIGFLILVAGWVFNDLIFSLIQKAIPEFNLKSKILILPLLFSGFLWQLSFLTHKMMELKEKTLLMTIAIIPSLIINIIGNNLFLPTFGTIATAYTSLFSALAYFVITTVHFYYSIRKLKTF